VTDDRAYLQHIRDAIDRITNYVAAGEQAFLSDSKTQDAVIRNLEIIGEAVKSLSVDLKNANADIPWKRIAGMRDQLIHGYFGVNIDLVWGVVANEIPALIARVEQLLKSQ
jgi:uncharacterized protein with HEPN domain